VSARNYSLFRVSYKPTLAGPEVVLGSATMSDNNVRFKPNAESAEFFIEQQHGWLTGFQVTMRKLVRFVGHTGRGSCAWDVATGINVERI
jgi:hypothetical protein